MPADPPWLAPLRSVLGQIAELHANSSEIRWLAPEIAAAVPDFLALHTARFGSVAYDFEDGEIVRVRPMPVRRRPTRHGASSS